MASTEEIRTSDNNNNNKEEEEEKEQVYKTKLIQFLGRSTPIILQNDNGPCPLLAICNVLLLRNNLNLNNDMNEVSLQKLLSLVAERLIDSNSNTENKDAGYLENQQQNIGDAIDLLPRLATGIDVNVQFRKIDDFEFTRECAIFDLLDMPLYHGWIVDPQDAHTANAIGSKSYNTLMGELVALEASNTEQMHKSSSVDDCIDFAAATTATLGVPSPSLSRAMSFEDSPRSESAPPRERKGDKEEEEDLKKALQLSNTEVTTTFDESFPGDTTRIDFSAGSVESSHPKLDTSEVHPEGHQQLYQPEQSMTLDASGGEPGDGSLLDNNHSSAKGSSESCSDLSCHVEPISNDISEHLSSVSLTPNVIESLSNPEEDLATASEGVKDGLHRESQFQETYPQASTSSDHLEQENQRNCSNTDFSGTSTTDLDHDVSNAFREHIETPKSDGSEPIYEGEDRILDSEAASYENREPMYEGEVVLAEQADSSTGEVHPLSDITEYNGELITNFLRNNASQLTIYGLFCLQEGLKERELCVFFRNNHFSTMFKFNGELYLLATDQGYINQPDLVWEKLNEVNGDTVFMTGNFTEFKVDEATTDTWNQQNAVANTTDYLASIDSSATESTFNTDLQLAIALQQQEFDNQPQRNQNSQQPSSGGHQRLVTGPQVQRTNPHHSTPKPETKKDKCIVM
ncbi:hypothetical protein ACHQM5_011305 [Ranunculus cassubicifolius]